MIDVSTEELISLADAVKHYPGTRPHRATVFRHAMRGVRGRRLETVKVGGKRFTSVEAIRRFARNEPHFEPPEAERANSSSKYIGLPRQRHSPDARSDAHPGGPDEIEHQLRDEGF